MVIDRHRTFYEKLRPYYKGDMLMIGNQESTVGDLKTFFGVNSYQTLDPDGGDYTHDLTGDVSEFEEKFDCVMDVGTLEHIWDIHTAFCNAVKMVKVGGYFISVHATAHAVGHGVHVTESWAILSFLEKNGFERLDIFQTDDAPTLGKDSHINLWSAHRKVQHISNNFQVPLQIYENNRSVNK